MSGSFSTPPADGMELPAEPAKPANVFAMLSLATGISGFLVPGIGGILGVIFGVVALARDKTGDPRGRGMALAGISVGLISMLFWGVFGFGLRSRFAPTAAPKRVAVAFLQDMFRDRSELAATNADAPALTLEALKKDSSALSAPGPAKSITFTGTNPTNTAGITTVTFTGTVTRTDGSVVPVSIAVTHHADGWRVSSFTHD